MSKKPEFDCVAIFAGAYTDGLRSRGLACLQYVTPEETVIDRQIRLVTEYLPRTPIYVLARNDSDKIIRSVGGKISIVENQLENSNDIEDVRLLMNVSRCKSMLGLFGDISIDEKLFRYIPQDSFLITTTGKNDNDQLGVISHNGYVTSISFGLPDVWSGIFGLQHNELAKLRKFATREKGRLYMFEGLNGIINNGAKISVVNRDGSERFYFGSGKRTQRRNIHIINNEKK